MPQDIPTTCNGCVKKFSIEHALSYPKGGLIFARHDDSAKEWGAFASRTLVPSDITYEPKINSRTLQEERTGAVVRQEYGIANGGMDIAGDTQEGSVPKLNRVAVLARNQV